MTCFAYNPASSAIALTKSGSISAAEAPGCVRDDLILELARLVDDDALANRLESAYGRDVKVLALDIPERETIIRALEDPPPGLEELRGVLLEEHVWRHREGLNG